MSAQHKQEKITKLTEETHKNQTEDKRIIKKRKRKQKITADKTRKTAPTQQHNNNL